ncbi:BLUF domain-containing protein [Winogradskyella sp.]|uniref:BLUF domain-containing protein n=1 Tax=Winogradskyella sp. TaxID=1883156 RepID=UPI001B0E37BD|nr:BLUF domain-containing protein [Winogradskyella sp.]MBO6879639.1 BLUF domain-containing protein [Winogradskyella sp.]
MYYSVIYQSKSQSHFAPMDIELMLMKAKRKNKRLKITGCIVYADNKFIQLIQGPKDAIIDLYKEIKADKRHFKVTTLLEQSTEQKIWSDWSMAMLDFSGNAKQVMNSRILLESYLENVTPKEKESDSYKVFRASVNDLLNASEQHV